MIDTQSADLIARAINAQNARRTSRADAGAAIALVVVLGIIAAAAAWHWLASCNVMDGAAMCALAAIPTRRNPAQRLLAAVQAWHLRVRIRACEQDAEHHAEMAELAPVLEQMARDYAAELRVQLATLEAR